MARRRDDDEKKPKKKKKPAREVVEDEDDDFEDDELPLKKRGPRDDAFTGLLAVALVAMIATAVLFYLDTSELSGQTLSAPNVAIPALGDAGKAAGL